MKIFYGLLVILALVENAMAEDSVQLAISPMVSKDNLMGNYLDYRIDIHTGERSDPKELVLRRKHDLIAYERSEISDVWERNSVGTVSYLQVYHDFKAYIEYLPADFNVLEQAEPEWEQIGALFDLKALESLEVTGHYVMSEQDVTVYEGELEGLSVTVHWIMSLNLPVRLEYRSEDIVQVMVLQSLFGNEDAPWPQWDSTKYFGIDFVDMGDNESHPLIQALNAGQAGGHQH
tara:strand:- start:382 stop:1080 length:699 start_codon:yes stop_codon:yes gene_type:complete